MSEEFNLNCPVCGARGLRVNSSMVSIPYFNQLAMFTIHCDSCGFNHNDVFSTEEREPCRWTYRVTGAAMLNTRVVRSGSGTIRIPDFGIDVEPGPSAESFISNVEGVLLRIRTVLEGIVVLVENETEKDRGRAVIEMLDQAMAGSLPFTLVIEDPAGVSAILPDDMTQVKYERLSKEEAASLRGAPNWLQEVREDLMDGRS
ncbi:MAG: ZPR1 zinc finger domain-containing protein [Candidatus Thorarchaeota archaeon]